MLASDRRLPDRLAAAVRRTTIADALRLAQIFVVNLDVHGRISECRICPVNRRRATFAVDVNGRRFRCGACGSRGDVLDVLVALGRVVDREEAAELVGRARGIAVEDRARIVGAAQRREISNGFPGQ